MYFAQAHNFTEWRQVSRELLKRHIKPDQILWDHKKQNDLLTNEIQKSFMEESIKDQNITISQDFISCAKYVACFRDENRWSLLYRIAWRLIYEDRKLLNCKVDPHISQFFSMRKAVGRDKHKMEAFLRFRLVKDNNIDDEIFISWFEPEHLILPITASFFKKRFHNMHWSILTPDACLHWNKKTLKFTQGVKKPHDINDELENLWQQYYMSIFNPARLKLKAMQSEMPKKYWINLPEAPLIKELTRNSSYQTHQMINNEPRKIMNKSEKTKLIQEENKLSQ